jgi:hypothetical protein
MTWEICAKEGSKWKTPWKYALGYFDRCADAKYLMNLFKVKGIKVTETVPKVEWPNAVC